MIKLITIFLTLFSISSFGQSMKTYNGVFSDGKTQNGTAFYTYYEDAETHEYLKQGLFKYTFNGKGDYNGYNQTITGNFEKGFKNGTWIYAITMSDFGNDNPYYTGTVSLVANYKNGNADGNWKEIRSYKLRKKYLVYGQYKWEPFEALKTMTIDMNFSEGKLVGAININDEFAKFKATGNYDNNSLCTGTWMINDMGFGKNRELIYKDNLLFEFIARSNNGEVLEGSKKYELDWNNYVKGKGMSLKEKEEAGLSIDTVCGTDLCSATNNIQEYFPKLLSNDYFLYQYIGGDLSFTDGFKGGCDIHVRTTNYTSLSNAPDFSKAEEYYNKNDLLRAYEIYIKINLNNVKPSERELVTDKINFIKPQISNLIEIYKTNDKFLQDYLKAQHDSLELDLSYFGEKIPLKTNTDNNGWTSIIDDNGLPVTLFDGGPYGIHFNFEKPWENKNWYQAQKCFDDNKGIYSNTQIAITEQYFKYYDFLEAEEAIVKKTNYFFTYNNIDNYFYTYNKDTFLSDLSINKKDYNLSKSFIDLEIKSQKKKNQIETLNNLNKKKILFSKYQVVIKEFNSKLHSNSDIQSSLDTFNKLDSFLDQVINLYNQDSTELEKKLKDSETTEQILSVILGK